MLLNTAIQVFAKYREYEVLDYKYGTHYVVI